MPSSPEFTLGYYDGSQQAKVWLYTTEDLVTMYSKYPKGGVINFWCDGVYLADRGSQKRKRGEASVEQSSHRKAKEDENESIFKDLREKHSIKYDTPQLRLWSRMIAAGIHDDYDEPPDIPAFLSVRGNARSHCLIALVEQLLLLLRHCKTKAKRLQQVLFLCQLGYRR